MNRENLITEMWVVLDIISAEFRSDPSSVACFDLSIVERANDVVKNFRPFFDSPGDLPVSKEEAQDLEEAIESIKEAADKGTESWEDIKDELKIKTVPELLKQEAEKWAIGTANDYMFDYKDEESYKLGMYGLIRNLTKGYLAGYEAAEKSIRAELSSPSIPVKKTKRTTKSSKRAATKKVPAVRKSNNSRVKNKTSLSTKRGRKTNSKR